MSREIVWRGRFVSMVRKDGWEYATRENVIDIVGIVPVTDDGRLILVEQYRPAVEGRVIELPAGLAGDTDGSEASEAAARRELLEETGYQAAELTPIFGGVPSPGICDEHMTFYLATGLQKLGPGGGDHTEDIIVHEVPVGEVRTWLRRQEEGGKLVDVKLYAGLLFALEHVGS